MSAGADPVQQSRDAGVPSVALRQVDGELHRELAGRPLTGVVEAIHVEGRAPVAPGHPGGDLDAQRPGHRIPADVCLGTPKRPANCRYARSYAKVMHASASSDCSRLTSTILI